MPKAQCQHCESELADFPKTCPQCQKPILGATAIKFLGQGLTDFLEVCGRSSPQQARKKTTLYLKFCQKFICDSELALLSVKMFSGLMDERSIEAIDDVIKSHQNHSENLKKVFAIISGNPELEPVAKRVNNSNRRIETLLKLWLNSDFGGRSIKR